MPIKVERYHSHPVQQKPNDAMKTIRELKPGDIFIWRGLRYTVASKIYAHGSGYGFSEQPGRTHVSCTDGTVLTADDWVIQDKDCRVVGKNDAIAQTSKAYSR